jgi:hypothetical protein
MHVALKWVHLSDDVDGLNQSFAATFAHLIRFAALQRQRRGPGT